jgi:hypothetical protein
VKRLTKGDAIALVQERAEIFDRDRNPFGKAVWLKHFIEQIVRPEWRVCALESSVDGEGVMLLVDDGTRVRPLANYYTSLYSPVTPNGAGQLHQLVRQLNGVPTVSFSPLDADDPRTAELHQALRANNWYVRRYFAAANWYLPNPGSFDEYLAGRDSQLRNTIKRKGKAFRGELRIITDPAEVDAAMAGYERLAAAQSWKQPESHPAFVREWARICAANGWLRLGIAKVDDAAIAVHFWFVVDGIASIFKLAFDESQAKLSAGTLVTAMLMRHALDVDKVAEVDYLTGDDPYKAAWMTRRRERIGLMACNRRTLSGLARAAFEFAAQMRHWRPA